MTVIKHHDSDFIETFDGEDEGAWGRAVEEMLTHVWEEPKSGWWHPFTAGPVVHWGGRAFRSFRCVAGSVFAHLIVKATRGGQMPRGIMVIGYRHTDNELVGTAWCNGQEQSFKAADIVAQLPADKSSSRLGLVHRLARRLGWGD